MFPIVIDKNQTKHNIFYCYNWILGCVTDVYNLMGSSLSFMQSIKIFISNCQKRKLKEWNRKNEKYSNRKIVQQLEAKWKNDKKRESTIFGKLFPNHIVLILSGVQLIDAQHLNYTQIMSFVRGIYANHFFCVHLYLAHLQIPTYYTIALYKHVCYKQSKHRLT